MRPGQMHAAALLAAAILAAPAGGQDARPLRHRVTFPESFGFLQSVRELQDGRVMAADPLGGTLAILDLNRGTMTPVGREGAGPEEWRQPDAVYALPGDSTLLVDLGNARLAVIDPAGRFVDTHPIGVPQTRPGAGPFEIMMPRGVDARGRIYYLSRGMGRHPGARPDSSTVRRWSRHEGEEPVSLARLAPPKMAVSSAGGGGRQSVTMRPIPLAPEDDWAVAADGRVAVVRAEPYRVEWHAPDGGVVRGPELPARPVRVGGAEKERWLEQMAAGGLAVSVEVGPQGPSMRFQRGGGRANTPAASDYEWPETLPPFRAGVSLVDHSGRLWVARHGPAAGPASYDVVDARGAVVARYTVPAGHRIIAVTGRGVYAVRTDDLGLSWLEVFEAPAA